MRITPPQKSHGRPNQTMKPTQHFGVSSRNAHIDFQSAGWLISFSLGFTGGVQMKPEIISSIGAFISAVCAIALLYLYRSQGKGFVWTKDHKISIGVLQDGKLDLAIEIPIFNLGRGAIKFLRLR